MDDVFIEQLWHQMKYECVNLHAFEAGLAPPVGLRRWVSHYNTVRPHVALSSRKPKEAYFEIGSPVSRVHAPAAAVNLKLAA